MARPGAFRHKIRSLLSVLLGRHGSDSWNKEMWLMRGAGEEQDCYNYPGTRGERTGPRWLWGSGCSPRIAWERGPAKYPDNIWTLSLQIINLNNWKEVGMFHGLQGSESLLVVVPGQYTKTSRHPSPASQLSHLSNLSRKSRASGLTKCWFSLWTNLSHLLRECLPRMSENRGSSSIWYLSRYS